MNESCHAFELVLSHICMSHVTYANKMNGSWHAYESWVMLHMCMSHVTHMNTSCYICEYDEWVMPHVRVMSHIWKHSLCSLRRRQWCVCVCVCVRKCVMSHIWMSHVTYMKAFLMQFATKTMMYCYSTRPACCYPLLLRHILCVCKRECTCVCVCVCVRKRERERECVCVWEREIQREYRYSTRPACCYPLLLRHILCVCKRECMCVCVCVCVCEREKER